MFILVLQHSLLLPLVLHAYVLQLLHVLQQLQSYQVCHVIAPSAHINDSILLLADAVAVDGIEVLGCGIISWRPPPGNELEELGYIVRFFEGSTYATTTGYRNQQYIGTDDIGKQSAVAQDLPYGTTVYAEVSVHVQCSMFYEHIIII